MAETLAAVGHVVSVLAVRRCCTWRPGPSLGPRRSPHRGNAPEAPPPVWLKPSVGRAAVGAADGIRSSALPARRSANASSVNKCPRRPAVRQMPATLSSPAGKAGHAKQGCATVSRASRASKASKAAAARQAKRHVPCRRAWRIAYPTLWVAGATALRGRRRALSRLLAALAARGATARRAAPGRMAPALPAMPAMPRSPPSPRPGSRGKARFA